MSFYLFRLFTVALFNLCLYIKLRPCWKKRRWDLLFWGILFYGFFEAWNVREFRLVIPTAKLPQGVERLRVVQISDIHLGGVYYKAHLERVMGKVRAARLLGHEAVWRSAGAFIAERGASLPQ